MSIVANNRSRKRNGEIDFLRFVFAVMILLHHSRFIVGDDACRYIGGSLAVEFYFVVSGYLLASSALRAGACGHAESLGTETYRFVMHKIKAILPEWLTAWTIGFVFVLYADDVHGISAAWQRFVDYFWELTLLRSTGLHIAAFDGVMWYLSSMFLCMAILYPLLRRWPDMMARVGCPLIALLLLGYLFQETGTLRSPHDWMGFTFKGNLRAMAELCCGVVCYYAARRLRRIQFTVPGRVLIMGMEGALYVWEIRYMMSGPATEYDYTMLFVFVLAVMFSFSGQGMQAILFENAVVSGVCSHLATFAMTLFLSHIYIAQHLNNLIVHHGASLGLSIEMSDHDRVIWYVLMALVNTLVVMLVSYGIRRFGGRLLAPIRKFMIL